MKKEQRKRVDIVKIKMVKEKSVLYEPRKISSPNDATKLIREFLADLDREALLVLCLDTKNQPITINICSIGSINSSIAHPREVFKTAILSNATSIIIAHNHLSHGQIKPSSEDKAVTMRIKEAGEIIGIPLTDHIIVGRETDQFISLKRQGEI